MMEFQIMREMHWSWSDLMATPYEVVLNTWKMLSTEARFIESKSKEGKDG